MYGLNKLHFGIIAFDFGLQDDVHKVKLKISSNIPRTLEL